jgi:hypothetical protein
MAARENGSAGHAGAQANLKLTFQLNTQWGPFGAGWRYGNASCIGCYRNVRNKCARQLSLYFQMTVNTTEKSLTPLSGQSRLSA